MRAVVDGCLKQATYAAASLDSGCEIVCVGADMMHKLLDLDLYQHTKSMNWAFQIINVAFVTYKLFRHCNCVDK